MEAPPPPTDLTKTGHIVLVGQNQNRQRVLGVKGHVIAVKKAKKRGEHFVALRLFHQFHLLRVKAHRKL